MKRMTKGLLFLLTTVFTAALCALPAAASSVAEADLPALLSAADGFARAEEALYFILNQILILLLRNSTETAKPEKQSRITSIIHYLHENYTYPITLNELAKQFYLSPLSVCKGRQHVRCA